MPQSEKSTKRTRAGEGNAPEAAEAAHQGAKTSGDELKTLLEGRLQHTVTDDELQRVQRALIGCDELHSLRAALLPWDPATPLPELPPTAKPANWVLCALLKASSTVANELKILGNDLCDDLLACQMAQICLRSTLHTLKQFATLHSRRKGLGNAEFLACGRVFMGDEAATTIRTRFVGPASRDVKPLTSIPAPEPGKVAFYSGPSGSGKTVNACMYALGLDFSEASVNSNYFLIYLVPGVEKARAQANAIEALMSTANSEGLKPQRNAQAEVLVLRLAADATGHHAAIEPHPLDEPQDETPPWLTVVLDEMGPFPHLARGICAQQKSITQKLAKRYGTTEGCIRLCVVGSGVYGGSTSPGTLPGSYSFHTCGIQQPDTDADEFFSKLLRGSQLSYAVKDAVAEHLSRGSDQVRTIRALTTNARCAALIVEVLTVTFPPPDPRRTNSKLIGMELETAVGEAMSWVAVLALTRFTSLNGLSDVSTDDAFRHVCQAIAVATRPLWETKEVADDVSSLICKKYGLLTDNAQLVLATAVPADHYTIEDSTEFDPPHSLVLRRGQRRYSIQAAHVVMALVKFGGIAQDASWQGFELLLRDFCLVCSLISPYCDYFEPHATAPGGWRPKDHRGKLTTGEQNYWHLRCILHQGTAATHRVEMRQQLAPTQICMKALTAVTDPQGESRPSPLSTTFSEWLDLINDNTAIVVLNGARAPFADVVVLSPNKLVLLQAKQTSTNHSIDDEEENKKMLDRGLIRQLQKLCAVDGKEPDEVAVYRLIVSVDSTTNEDGAAQVTPCEFHFHTNSSPRQGQGRGRGQGEETWETSLFFPMITRYYERLPKFSTARSTAYPRPRQFQSQPA